MPKTQNVYKAAGDKISLARTYAEDGAFFSAARCLREAADILEAHGTKVNEDLDALVKGTKTK